MINNDIWLVACCAVLTYSSQSLATQDNDTSVKLAGKDIQLQWLDDFHADFSHQAKTTAQQIDDFFADDNHLDSYDDAKAEGRVRLSWEPRTRDMSDVSVRLRFRMKLPKLKNRVDLVLSDLEDDKPDNSVKTARDGHADSDSYNLALRYQTSPQAHLSSKLGFGRTNQLFLRSRYRNDANFSQNLSYKYEGSINYYSEDKFGADAGFTLDYNLSPTSILRFNSHYYFSRENNQDWSWRHLLENRRILDEHTALVFGGYIDGSDNPNYRQETALIYTRWRKNALREWLFFELEPFVVWYRDEHFSMSYGIAIRVEGHYGKD